MNANYQRLPAILALAAGLALSSSATLADPLPGRDTLKFSQRPMDATKLLTPNGTVRLVYGHDELSTAYQTSPLAGGPGFTGRYMADDFADKFASPVVHVKWWGSYLDNIINPQMPVDKFLISFEADVPANPNDPTGGFSRPGLPLLNQIVRRGPLAPGSGTFTEKPISPGGPPLGEHLFEYNAELHLGKEFAEHPDTVYWLKIVALVDNTVAAQFDPYNPPAGVTRWGWHNRDYTIADALASTAPAVTPGEYVDGAVGTNPIYHFQDDAVTGQAIILTGVTPNGNVMPVVDQFSYKPTRYVAGADGPAAIEQHSKDLAFELYTIPEPASCAIALTALALFGVRRRGTAHSD